MKKLLVSILLVCLTAGFVGAETWSVLTSSSTTYARTLKPGAVVFVDTSTAPVTVYLPASPTTGARCTIRDKAFTFHTNNLTIDRNGSKIHGATSNLTISKRGLEITLAYVDATEGWVNVSSRATNAHIGSSDAEAHPYADTDNGGFISDTDWDTFNDKVDGPVTPTPGWLTKWAAAGRELEDAFKYGPMTDLKFCTWSTTNGLVCTADGTLAYPSIGVAVSTGSAWDTSVPLRTAWGTPTLDAAIASEKLVKDTLDGKVDENAPITGATKTKLTYDAKGLVTSGADATTADIADSLDKRYVTDAQLVVIGNTSGTNTGDETQSTIKTKLGAASSGVDGYLTGSDYDTFNSKQAGDATLTSIAGLGTAADKTIYTTGIDTWAETGLTSFGRSLIDDVDASAARTTLSAQASHANLSTLSSPGNWKAFHSDGSAAIQALALGAAGTVYQSNGASSAPSFWAPPMEGVDVCQQYGSGSTRTDTVINAALTAIGTVNKTIVTLSPGTWTFSSSRDWSSYSNITWQIAAGAVISHGAYNITLAGTLLAGPYQIFSGTGTITATSLKTPQAYAEWFGCNGVDDGPAMSEALASFHRLDGVPQAIYQVQTQVGISSEVQINGNNAQYNGHSALAGYMFAALATGHDYDSSIVPIRQVRVENMNVDLNGSGGFLWLRGVHDATVKTVDVRDSATATVNANPIFLHNVFNVIVEHCNIIGGLASGSKAILLESDKDDDGYSVINNIAIRDNEIRNWNYGFYLDLDPSTSTLGGNAANTMEIVNNAFQGNLVGGVGFSYGIYYRSGYMWNGFVTANKSEDNLCDIYWHEGTDNFHWRIAGWHAKNAERIFDIDSRETPSAWVTLTPYVEGDFVAPTVPNGFAYECTAEGTTGGSEPSWPTIVGQTVTDGTATWTCRGAVGTVEISNLRYVSAGSGPAGNWYVLKNVDADVLYEGESMSSNDKLGKYSTNGVWAGDGIGTFRRSHRRTLLKASNYTVKPSDDNTLFVNTDTDLDFVLPSLAVVKRGFRVGFQNAEGYNFTVDPYSTDIIQRLTITAGDIIRSYAIGDEIWLEASDDGWIVKSVKGVWRDESENLIDTDSHPVSGIWDGVEYSAYAKQITLPVRYLGDYSDITIEAWGDKVGGFGTKRLRFVFGATTAEFFPATNNTDDWMVRIRIIGNGNATQRILWDAPPYGFEEISAAEDISGTINVGIIAGFSAATDYITLRGWRVVVNE